MPWRYRFLVIALLVAGGGIFGVWRLVAPSAVPDTPLVSFAPEEQAVSFRLVVVAEDGDEKSFVFCERQRCEPVTPPESLGDEAVTDGHAWLHYVEAESTASKLVKRILVQRDIATGETKQIIERTPLTSPRGLYISPSGKKLAFFLDNIDRPEDDLTELWFYDQASGGVRLLMEKIFAPDVKTPVRWNRASSHLWFVADVGKQNSDDEVLQLVVVGTQPPKAAARFLTLDWQELLLVAQRGVMDINQNATRLAYAVPKLLGASELVIVAEDGASHATSARGTIPYIQWLEDDSALYVVQDRQGFSFWRVSGAVHRFIARRPGTMLSAHSDGPGNYIAFIAQEGSGPPELLALTHASGRIGSLGQLPALTGTVHLVQVQREVSEGGEQPAVTQVLEDAELAAFLEKQAPAIAGQTIVTPLRLLATAQDNTMYFDYRTPQGREERALVVVRDAALNEWSIKARYLAERGEWRKVQGGGLDDPAPTRLYEWETALKQWILKQEL